MSVLPFPFENFDPRWSLFHVVAERLKVEDGVNTVSFMWSRLPMSQVEETKINELLAARNSFTLGTRSDKWNWRLESLGIFSVKESEETDPTTFFY
ncbi:hypothetical protein HanPI659440_Chr09g0321861 [Helianthus annuus]|nr:hypothetical protein HanPI659440_Chr09g0321861 [Helianthus annuus]